MRLLGPEAFEEVFAPLRGLRAGYLRLPGNVGDALIEAATFQLLDEFGIAFSVQDPAGPAGADVLLVAGGGNMGGFYRGPAALRRRALTLGPPVVVLPQTFLGPEDLPYHRVFVRERRSLRFCPPATLAPDLALGLCHDVRTRPSRRLGVWLRQDAEGCFRGHPCDGDPARRCRSPLDYLGLAAAYEHVVTDRLHFAVAALVCGRQVTLLPNAYFKNEAVHEAWLRGLGCGWAERPPVAG